MAEKSEKSTPIFLVTRGAERRLIRAPSLAAVKHRLIDEFEARRASQDDLVDALKAGIEVE